MNIKITYNWLLEYLDTDATPEEMQKYLSLCGPSIERIERVGDDYVFDIEVTSNRVDMASVFGIAQEAQAILPRFGKKARIKSNPLENYSFNVILGRSDSDDSRISSTVLGQVDSGQARMTKELHIAIEKPELCSRFTAMVLSNVTIGKSPEIIGKRLQMCGIKSIDNVVDISNYLMLSLGQPTHIFDYDGIGKGVMVLRESRKGEKITTLDEKKFALPGGGIVIEDGNGDIIDLCGIMGGLNSSVKDTTKNIVLFVQTYNKAKIRRTSMTTDQRTVAATYFEKGLDEERVEPTFAYGVELLEKYTGAKPASSLHDIYPDPYKTRILLVKHEEITSVMGVSIESNEVVSILNNLGFETQKRQNDVYQIMIPSWRSDDIEIPEDIVEEVARVYGYHNLPSTVQSTTFVYQPKDIGNLFLLMAKIKYFLKHIGLHEVMNYSMVSVDLLQELQLPLEKHLELENTISEEIRYFRKSLLPSLIKNLAENQGRKEILKFFEVAKVYFPKEGDLPDEEYKLGIGVDTSFYDLKGMLEALFSELKTGGVAFEKSSHEMFLPNVQTHIAIDGTTIGTMGELQPSFQNSFNLKSPIYLAELDFKPLAANYQIVTSYTSPAQYATIKLDLTLTQKPELPFATIKQTAFQISSLLKNIEVLDLFENKLTLRFYFGSNTTNLTEREAQEELEKIKSKLM